MTEEIMTLPLLALRGMMVFPGMIINLDVGREKSIAAVEAAMEGDRRLLLVTQKDAALTDVQPEDLYKFGALAEVKQLLKLPNGAIRILVEGLERVEYVSITDSATEKVYFTGHARILEPVLGYEVEVEALRRMLIEAFEQWVLVTKKVNSEVLQALKGQPDPGRVTDMIAGYLAVPLEEKQQLLELANVQKRMHKLYEMLSKELEIAQRLLGIAQEEQAVQHDRRRCDRHALHRQLTRTAALGRAGQHQQARCNRKKNCKAQHRLPSFTGWRQPPSQSPASAAERARR